jgi:hypothetical protein
VDYLVVGGGQGVLEGELMKMKFTLQKFFKKMVKI